MSLVNFHLSVWTDPGKIYRQLDGVTLAESSYCRTCDFCRPNRSHHCRRCNVCIKRMDHHCVWIGNCVGFYNQGHFVRLVVYATAQCYNALLLLAARLNSGLAETAVELTTLQVLTLTVAIVLLIPTTTILSFLTYNQLKMLLVNRTTIEDREFLDDKQMGLDPDTKYDVGVVENISQVLGHNRYLWWLPQPMSCKGDGVVFATRDGGYDDF
ncbi:Palmitoyltransferase [Kappamyces sp. JEL0680]|nr:Palmitoyltransferase [Kappamyces sp. JEL0680]